MKRTLPLRVVGGKHHRMNDAGDMKLLYVGAPLVLEREQDNKYDPFAIKVFVQTEGEKFQIGYVAGFQSRHIAEFLDDPAVVVNHCKVIVRSTKGSLEAQLELDVSEVPHAEG